MIEDDNYDIRNFGIIPHENEGDVTDEDEEDELNLTMPNDIPGQVEVDFDEYITEDDPIESQGDNGSEEEERIR